MVVVQCPDYRDIFEGPAEVNVENVQYWCRHSKELKQTQVSKALKFVRFECIKYLSYFDDHKFNLIKDKYPDAKQFFVCLPLNTSKEHKFFNTILYKEPYGVDYNNSEYLIFKKSNGTFECNCQGWQSKKKKGEIVEGGANCSHILALFYMFKLKRFGNDKKTEEN